MNYNKVVLSNLCKQKLTYDKGRKNLEYHNNTEKELWCKYSEKLWFSSLKVQYNQVSDLGTIKSSSKMSHRQHFPNDNKLDLLKD